MAEGADRAKRLAAEDAVRRYVRPGMRLALGTGSTAAHAVRAVRAAYPNERFDCVASSRATDELARTLGLGVRPLRAGDRFDLMLDGADEVAPNLDLTKGGGGALFREKLLAELSDRLVIVVDTEKLVPALGTRFSIPVEVVPFARPVLIEAWSGLGLRPRLREDAGGVAMRTDNGNELVDLRPVVPIVDPARLHAELKGRTGVVETGLFVGLAHSVVVGDPKGTVRLLERPGRPG